MEPTDEQKEAFLEHVRDGKNRSQAAEEVGSTGTKFKFLCRRDAEFNRRFEEATLEGRGTLIERLETCATEMALGGHWLALKFLLTTYGEQFAWARTNKVEVDGQVQIQAVASVLSRYLPADQYDQLIQVVEQKMLEEGTPPALSAVP